MLLAHFASPLSKKPNGQVQEGRLILFSAHTKH